MATPKELITVSQEFQAPVEEHEHAVIFLGAVPVKDDQAMLVKASGIAQELAKIVQQQHLFTTIGRKHHVHVEGWTTLLAMLGIVPVEVDNVADEEGNYTATVELRRIDTGAVITRATSECGMDEPTWAARHNYARRSMAATRATGKACRLAYSWIMVLAGYSPTPFEEMPYQGHDAAPVNQRTPIAAPVRQSASAPAARSGGGGGVSEKQIKRAYAIARKAGASKEDIQGWMTSQGIVDPSGRASFTAMTRPQYDELCDVVLPNWGDAQNNDDQMAGQGEEADYLPDNNDGPVWDDKDMPY